MSEPEQARLPFSLADRLALRPKEAAEALGISERALRSLRPELPQVRLGRTVLFPVKLLEEWLAQRASADRGRADRIVGEILDDIGGDVS